MPGDGMNSLIQKIARQAVVTFRKNGGIGSSDGKGFSENINQLKKLVSEIRADDLKISPQKINQGPISFLHNPPVTYMHICENDCFSMGVFLLKGGSSIPLHDHPGMHGMLKVLYGKVRISGFDKLDSQSSSTKDPPVHQFNPPLSPYQKPSLRRAALRSVGEFSDASGPCLLGPHLDNLHQITALDGPAAFLDILAPPYDPDDGRDCHYYKLLQQASGEPGGKPEGDGPVSAAGAGAPPMEVWLLEIPQPADFWCGGEPYPGPQVSI